MKNCRKCGVKFIPTEHQKKKHDFACDECRKFIAKEWRKKRKESGRPVISTKMPRKYHAEYEKKYFQIQKNKDRRNLLAKKYRNDPNLRMKHEARWQTNHAIESGKIIKKPCEICGNKKVDAHHEDYFKPLEIKWFCRKHHTEHHKKDKK